MQFNQRTTRIIEGWAEQHNFRMIHHRALEAIFKEAWKEKERSGLSTDSKLQLLRTARNRRWWDRIRQIPTRLKEPTERHASPGAVVEWEDPLVLVYGTCWRDFRDGLSDYSAWKRHGIEFINAVCAKWKLYCMRLAKPSAREATTDWREEKRQRVAMTLGTLPKRHEKNDVEPISFTWSKSGGCFSFVVDCKPLAKIINGQDVLDCMDLVDVVGLTVSNIEFAIDAGWCPNLAWADPVRWLKRQHNVVADALCNYAMDNATTWQETFAPELPKHFNLLIHSDGGSRHHCGAAAWIVEASYWDEDLQGWQLTPLAMSATYYDGTVSSFTAEAFGTVPSH
jgi:hypothetical protein